MPRLSRRAVVDSQIGVAVQDEKPRPEQSRSTANRTERPVEAGPVVAVFDPYAEPLIADPTLDHLSEISDAQDDFLRSGAG